MLSKSKARDLKQLLKHPDFTAAFDRLLVIPALWTDIQLGMLHIFLTLHCDEELLSYLGMIYKYWFNICGGEVTLLKLIDSSTCRRLQCRAPAISQADRIFIEAGMEDKSLFPLISAQENRDAMMKQLLATTTSSQLLIPTLYTLFENLKFLERPAGILKSLLDDKPHARKHPKSLYQCFKAIHKTKSIMRSSYQSLWFFALKNFAALVPATPRKEKHKPKPLVRVANPILWRTLAQMALDFSLQSRSIQKILSTHPQSTNADYDRQDPRDIYSESGDESLERRVGRPYQNAYLCNLSLQVDDMTSTKRFDTVTSTFVMKTTYLSFFDWSSTEAHDINVDADGDIDLLSKPATKPVEEPSNSRALVLYSRVESEPSEPEEEPTRKRKRVTAKRPVAVPSPLPATAEPASTAALIAPAPIATVQQIVPSVVQQPADFTVYLEKYGCSPETKVMNYVQMNIMLCEYLSQAGAWVVQDLDGYVLSRDQALQKKVVKLVEVL